MIGHDIQVLYNYRTSGNDDVKMHSPLAASYKIGASSVYAV